MEYGRIWQCCNGSTNFNIVLFSNTNLSNSVKAIFLYIGLKKASDI